MKLTEQELEENLKALLKMGWIILYYDVKNDREIYGSTQLGQEMYYAYTHWTGDRYDDKLTDHTTPIITREKSETYKNDLLMNKCLVERTDWSVVGTTEHPKQVYSATPNSIFPTHYETPFSIFGRLIFGIGLKYSSKCPNSTSIFICNAKM